MSHEIRLEYSDILKLETLNKKTIARTLLEYEIFDDDHLKNLKCICSEFGIEDEITHENYYGTYSKTIPNILKLYCQ